jgi:RimJ/RimL family protein N-acetyltransferase
MAFPLETERLFIRPLRVEDVGETHCISSDPEVMRWIPTGPSDSLETTWRKLARYAEHQARHGFSLWAVIEKTSGRIVGDCGLFLVEGRGPDVELAYRFARDAWGKGYASEAARECVRYGLEDLGLARIIAITAPEHVASRRVMEKIGLIDRGTTRLYERDLVLYATPPTAE